MASSFQISAVFVTLVLGAATAPAQESSSNPTDELDLMQELELDRSLPINLDADSSEFDRRSERLRFKGLYIKQGVLAIRADEAEADRLDFEDTVWTFSGNVLIENSTTRVWSDDAQVTFLNHQVNTATLQGSPARFEQVREEDERITQGRSDVMDYTLATGIISMTGDAWVSDGANEVTGPRIAYDVTRDMIKAAGDDDGQVRMRIIPPEDRKPDLP